MSVKVLIMDVDGTLTDGKIYMGEQGELFKAFNIKDGCGIKDILPRYGIESVIITGRQSRIVENRCREIGITELYQGVSDKHGKLAELLGDKGIRYTDCAYIGDDINDLPCMQKIKEAGGKVGCPADAVKEVRELADYVSSYKGGEGAVRDIIEWLCV